MAKFIRPQSINFRAEVTEEELRARLAEEVMESIGALDPEGKPLPGVVAKVLRGNGHKGGYTIDISGPMPARVYLPKTGE